MNKNFSKYILAFFIPIFILLIISIIIGCWPTSNNSIFIGDLWYQHYIFTSNFWKSLISGNSLNFSNNLGGGISIEFINAYYSLQPFGFLTLFDSFINESAIIFIINSLYLGIASTSMTFYCNSKKNAKIDISIYAGISYSLCGWFISYSSHIIWLWAFSIFPMLIYFFNKMMKEKNKIKSAIIYSIILASIIISNFFIGFIICIFLFLLFLSKMIFEKKEILKNTIYFVIFSFTSGLIASPILIVVVQNILNNNNNLNRNIINPSITEGFISFIIGIFPLNNNCVNNLNVYSCYSYTNILFIIGSILFFINKKIDKTNKKIKFSLILILSISMILYDVEKIWYGMDCPDGVYRRMSFILTFLLIECGYEYFINNEIRKSKKNIKTIIFIFSIPVFILFFNNISGAIVTILLFSIYLYLLNNKKQIIKYVIIIELFVVSFFQICTNGFYKYETQDLKIKNNEERIVYSYNYSYNNKSIINKNNNFSVYASGVNLYTANFMYSLNRNSGNTFYNSNNSILNVSSSFLGEKYLYSKNKENIPYFKYKECVDDIYIYENTNKLSLGYILPEDIKNYKGISNNMFDNNNEFSNLIINSSIYDKTNIIAKMNNNKIIFISDKDYEYLVLSFKTISNSTNSSQFKIFINNDLLYSDSNKSSFTKTVHLNNVKKGDKVEIYFENLLRISSFDLRSINLDALDKYYKTLTEQRLENVSFKNNTYTSNVKCQNDNSLLVLTIPYNKYLNAYVDGKKIEIEPIFDKAFCSLILNEGEHDIVILYKNNLPFYFIPLSIMSLLILLILYKKNKSSN